MCSNSDLSLLYEELGCAQIFMQEDTRKRPEIPALTKTGFVTWMAWNLLAYPNSETLRLQSIFFSWEVEPDGASAYNYTGRLPKLFPRELLPKSPDFERRKVLDQAVGKFMQGSKDARRMPWFST
jgi:hypothetical protein